MTDQPNGALLFLRTAHAAGVRVCFANPGTTELTLVRALGAVPGIRPVLGLFEGVCTGAADGYARVSGVPALTLLHLGPGLANGLANLHNARRARSPIINLVGDHATWHLAFDAPLTSDIDSLARPVSGAILRLDDAATLSGALRAAVAAATEVGEVVTVVAPTDVMDAPLTEEQLVVAPAPARQEGRPVPEGRLAACAKAIPPGREIVLLLGGNALSERGQRAAARIAESLSARVLMEPYPAIVALGGDLPRLERLAYFPQDVVKQLGEATVILAGAREPVSYFGYEGQPSLLVAAARLIELAGANEDCVQALEGFAGLVQRAGDRPRIDTLTAPPARTDALTPSEIVEAVIEQLPEDAVISLEGSTLGGPYLQQAHRARRHRVMTNTGGAIGQGLPCAVGAALARPDRRIIALQSDGSAHYTLQSLWTLARQRLHVTIIIAANHRYGILQTELRRSGADLGQSVLQSLTRLDAPRVDWVSLARGYGVPGVLAASSAEFHAALRRGLEEDGPLLIQAELS